MDDMQQWVRALIRLKVIEAELSILYFHARTGLPLTQISLVHFRGKMFPQWSGALNTLPCVQLEE